MLILTLPQLRQIAEYCVEAPEWQQKGTTTYCNFSVEHAARCFGIRDFTKADGRPMTANEITATLEKSWHEIPQFEDAQSIANCGRLVIAASKGNPHGHVCFLVPAVSMIDSATWGRKMPLCANVGPAKYTGIKGLNYAFSPKNPPKLYTKHDPATRPG
jgi:hypothetical protein